MSALSFLSKKSWHTGLQTNQKAVWEAEKSALDERRKLDELRKERDRERELQELERLHEESGGKRARRSERVEWMYNAPASGSNVDKNELEDYLLGKKRVDKLLKGDETQQLSRSGGAPSSATTDSANGVPVGSSVGSDRDVASKIREDPMFAIRQQEQAAYQALLKDPVRLRAMRKAAGLDEGKQESKEERRRRKEEKRRRRDEDDNHRHRRDRESDYHRRDDRRGDSERRRRDERRRDYGDEVDRRREDDRRREYDYDRRRDDERRRSDDRRDDDREYHRRNRDYQRRSRSRSPVYRHHDEDRRVRRTPSPSRPPPPRRQYDRRNDDRAPPTSTDADAERTAKLAAMQQNATDLSSSRSTYLAKVRAEEEADLERERLLREKVQKSRAGGRSGGSGGGFGASETKGSFLVDQERALYGSGGGGGEPMDLAERLRRTRDTLQRFETD